MLYFILYAPNVIFYLCMHQMLYFTFVCTKCYILPLYVPNVIFDLCMHQMLYFTFVCTKYYILPLYAPNVIFYLCRYTPLMLYFTFVCTKCYILPLYALNIIFYFFMHKIFHSTFIMHKALHFSFHAQSITKHRHNLNIFNRWTEHFTPNQMTLKKIQFFFVLWNKLPCKFIIEKQ